MTDFGRRAAAAAGPHKTTHQDGGTDEISIEGLSGRAADNQPPRVHNIAGTKHNSSTLAELNTKISDAALDDSGDPRTPSAHKASHQDGGSDEISVAGLVGTTPRAILGDAVAGRVLRCSYIFFDNGTTDLTLKCTLVALFNGDAIAETDNIAKDATTGHFALNAAGTQLIILNTGLTGEARMAMANIMINATAQSLLAYPGMHADGIRLELQGISNGTPKDLTTLVDLGDVYVEILYITHA